MAQRHEFVRRADLLGAGRMEEQALPVARHLQIAVGLGFNLSDMAKQRMNIVPRQVMRDRMLENRVVGAQV
jgi:hypothetical protein